MAVNLTAHPVGEDITLTQVALGHEVAFLVRVRAVDDMDIHVSIPMNDDQDVEDVQAEAAVFFECLVDLLGGEGHVYDITERLAEIEALEEEESW